MKKSLPALIFPAISRVNSSIHHLTFLIVFLFSVFNVAAQTGTATGIPTFNCIGITWSGSGGNANTVCNVQYRLAKTNAPWINAYQLWFDPREAGSGSTAIRPGNEYRGSIVGLKPGVTYEVKLSAGQASNSFIVTTWKETFPVGNTVIVGNADTTLDITTSGSATAYRLYTAATGRTATIDVANSYANCIYIDAAYVIVRGLIVKGAAEDAIVLGPHAHDVVIENNDISGWGYIGMGTNNQAGVRIKGFSYDARNIERIIVQRNKIHNPRENSNSWDAGGHPMGPNGINFEEAGSNHVIRYNEIYSDTGHYFMDGIGGADNFSFTGFPNANSDIYGNIVKNCYDDAIESEGGNCNVRIWGNFMDHIFTGIATATNSIGPLYIFRNVTNVSQRSPTGASALTIDNEDRGPFNKCGSPYDSVRGGRTFLFHNTILQPDEPGYFYSRGMGGGVVDNGGRVTNVVSRNNIWQTHKPITHPAIGEWQSPGNNSSYDYDLYNGGLVVALPGVHELHGVSGTPAYVNGVLHAGLNPSGYFLSQESAGVDKGTPLDNFNDGFTGAAPDIGAYENGRSALEFGTEAYLTPSSSNIPPVARTEADLAVLIPTDNIQLHGNASSDEDGFIASYLWTQVAGPVKSTVKGEFSSIATISNLETGVYRFMLKVTDNEGDSSAKEVTVMVERQAGKDAYINVYPNPSNSVLNMQYLTNATGKFRVKIYDTTNRLMRDEVIDKNQVLVTKTIDVSGFGPGNYFIRISSEDYKQKAVIQFIKM